MSWNYDSNDDVIMIVIPTSVSSTPPQWKEELLDANHHIDIVWDRDDDQLHIRTVVLQPRREEWQLMELF